MLYIYTLIQKTIQLLIQGIIWRFKFLMLSTLVAAALTVIGFIIGQVSEGAYKWDEDLGTTLEYTSGFLTGVYGMWNLYIFGLIFLYAPSHKKWGNEDTVSTGYFYFFILIKSDIHACQVR